jgi:hypothetical protein
MNLLQTEITWAQLRGLHQLFEGKSAKASLLANPFILRLKTDKRLLRFKPGNLNYIDGTTGFAAYFKSMFLPVYDRYLEFFDVSGVLSDGRRSYSLYDLETLIYIWKNKDILSDNLTTMRTFSGELFKGKGSKYLENNQSVLAAVLIILGIDKFPKSDPKERQWRLVIDCPQPNQILLCENLDALKMPEAAIALNTELWYVGGNNTRILKNLSTDKLKLPIYYLCDWDYDGLRIFETVQIILQEMKANVGLLFPHKLADRLPVNSPYHFSEWKRYMVFSNLNPNKYSTEARELINQLIAKNEWVEEESQDLESLLRYNGVID